MPRFFFFARLTFAWLVLLIFTFMIWSSITHRGMGGIFLLWVVLMCFVYASAVTHIRRVRLINGSVTASALANRQRRQIEVPMEPGRAFDLLDRAIRDLPQAKTVESARDRLQIHARVLRVYPLGHAVPLLQQLLGAFGADHNVVYAVITPHGETSTVNLSCDPESGQWRDWFTVDSATNLENAESISRAMSRGTTEVRRGEQAATKETEIEKELAVAKLRLLHAQVEPHFLYNTLGSAKYLIRSDPAGAEKIIDNLILYLRHSLPRLDNSLTTLGEELERVRAYLEIMQIRMGARLKTELNDDAADSRGERHQARTGAQVGRRHDLGAGTGQGRAGGHYGSRRRQWFRHGDGRQRHRLAERARTAEPRVRRGRDVRHRGQLPGRRGRHHHRTRGRPEGGSP